MKSFLFAAVLVASYASIGSAIAAPEAGHSRGARGGHGIEAFDTNKDGKVSREEFQAALEERWQAADTNRDGAVTADEAKQSRQQMKEQFASKRFVKLDVNHDGQITKDEAPHMPQARYERLDTNKDGAISADEFKASRAHKARRGGHCNGAPSQTEH